MRLLKWLTLNGLFCAGIYFGFYKEVGSIGVFVSFFAWFMLVVTLVGVSADDVHNGLISDGYTKPPLPPIVDFIYDACVVIALLCANAPVTAIVYTISCFFSSCIWSEISKKVEKNAENN